LLRQAGESSPDSLRDSRSSKGERKERGGTITKKSKGLWTVVYSRWDLGASAVKNLSREGRWSIHKSPTKGEKRVKPRRKGEEGGLRNSP